MVMQFALRCCRLHSDPLDLGERLALVTKDLNEVHLRIYDIKSKNGRVPICSTVLPNFLGDINRATFEPGGVYLALARSDNTTHIYDSRYLNKAVSIFAHEQGDTTQDTFGVVQAQWTSSFDTRRLGLLTGGIDGCVRLWDHRRSQDDPSNGTIIARMQHDIAHFQIGDPAHGEAALVVYVEYHLSRLLMKAYNYFAAVTPGDMSPSMIAELPDTTYLILLDIINLS